MRARFVHGKLFPVALLLQRGRRASSARRTSSKGRTSRSPNVAQRFPARDALHYWHPEFVQFLDNVFRDSLAFKPLFLRNAFHCVFLPGASLNSGVNAIGLNA